MCDLRAGVATDAGTSLQTCERQASEERPASAPGMPDAEAGLALCDERATRTTLLQSERRAGHATARGLHADSRWGEVGGAPERPAATADRSRGDEGPWAGGTGSSSTVNLDAGGKGPIG